MAMILFDEVSLLNWETEEQEKQWKDLVERIKKNKVEMKIKQLDKNNVCLEFSYHKKSFYSLVFVLRDEEEDKKRFEKERLREQVLSLAGRYIYYFNHRNEPEKEVFRHPDEQGI